MKSSSPLSPLASQSLQMVEVAGETYIRGDNTSEWNSEKPEHPVELSDFFIGAYPVNQALWVEIMGENPSHFIGDDLPVEQVSWEDCQKFLKELNQKLGLKGQEAYRLPTEAEWEYAARGGKYARKTEYAGSEALKEVAWFRNHSHIWTEIPGLRIPNELGIYDLSGNVYEWCQDWYGSYSDTPMKDPLGPASGSRRVLRGGSWIYGAGSCRVANRRHDRPDLRYYRFGLRLARTVL